MVGLDYGCCEVCRGNATISGGRRGPSLDVPLYVGGLRKKLLLSLTTCSIDGSILCVVEVVVVC